MTVLRLIYGLAVATFVVTGVVDISQAEPATRTETEDPINAYLKRPLPPFVTPQILIEASAAERRPVPGESVVLKVTRTHLIDVDTRNARACAKVQAALSNLKAPPSSGVLDPELCRHDPNHPYASITVVETIDRERFQKVISSEIRDPSERRLIEQARAQTYGRSTQGGFAWTPTAANIGYENEDERLQTPGRLFDEYYEAMLSHPSTGYGYTNAPAGRTGQIDRYAYSPISGTASYTFARQSGRSAFASVGQSIAMTSYYMEYSFASLPTAGEVQNILINPVIGAAVGEFLYQSEQTIRGNDDRVGNSRALGRFFLFALNPARSIAEGINQAANRRIFRDAHADFVVRRYTSPLTGASTQFVGIAFSFRFDGL